MPEPHRPATRGLNQRRLPDTHTTLDHEDPAAALQQLRYGRQLPLTLEQLLHKMTLTIRSRAIRTGRSQPQSCSESRSGSIIKAVSPRLPPPSPRSNATDRATLA